MAALPMELREPATLFFVHECSHQDIASFLNLPVATINNRLHAARRRLKERMLTMVTERLHERALPDDFANRIGRLIEARGPVVEALFDPAAMPDILSELALSDEAQKRAVNIQVVQRGAGGLVRGIALAPVDGVPRGATVLDSGRRTRTPVDLDAFPAIVARLGGAPRTTAGSMFETGIKVDRRDVPARRRRNGGIRGRTQDRRRGGERGNVAACRRLERMADVIFRSGTAASQRTSRQTGRSSET